LVSLPVFSLAVVLLLTQGCGEKPNPSRKLHLLDVGFPIEHRGSSLVTMAKNPVEAQFRAVSLPMGSEFLVRDIPWPARGTLEVQFAPLPGSSPEGRAVLEVSLHGAEGSIIELGAIEPGSKSKETFQVERFTWSGMERGVFGLAFKLVPHENATGTWLCNGGVLTTKDPFVKAKPRKDNRPNLVLIIIDTLRADHLGCYGYGRNTSPVLDRLAGEGLMFTDAWAQASWTKPSTATILTSLPTYDHGAVKRFDTLPSRVWTLSEGLAAAGYRTGAFIANGWIGNDHFNFNQGYDQFIKVEGKADDVCTRGIEWLALDSETPSFLYLHLMDPHTPYSPPEDLRAEFDRGYVGDVLSLPAGDDLYKSHSLTRENVEYLVDLYDAEIRSADRALGVFLEGLDALGIRDSTVLCITADHGEEFNDHGAFGHGGTLFEEQLEVPLVIAGPGVVPGGEIHEGLVRHMDIAPMLFGLLGLPVPDAFMGRNPLAEQAEPLYWALADLDKDRWKSVAVRVKQLKLIRSYAPEASLELYDLDADPSESRNLAQERSEQAEKLASFTTAYEARISRPGLYIACRGKDGVKGFQVELTGDAPPKDHVLRMAEKKDTSQALDHENGVRFHLEMDTPEDIDLIFIASELEGRYSLVIRADEGLLDPASVTLGTRKGLPGPWPLEAGDAFLSATLSASPPVDLFKMLAPGNAVVFRILPTKDHGGIPEATIDELRKLGYFGR